MLPFSCHRDGNARECADRIAALLSKASLPVRLLARNTIRVLQDTWRPD
jgi:hypothetical protein